MTSASNRKSLADLRIRSVPFRRRRGSSVALDVEEMSWVAFEVTAADLAQHHVSEALAMKWCRFREVMMAMDPGRVVTVTEVARVRGREIPKVSFALGTLGPTGSTRTELAGFGPILDDLLGATSPYSVEPMHPGVLFPAAFGRRASRRPVHATRIVKNTVTVGIEDDDDGPFDVAIPGLWTPTFDVWGVVVKVVASAKQPVWVRSTLLNAMPRSFVDEVESVSTVVRLAALDAPAGTEAQWAPNLALVEHHRRTLTSPIGTAEIVIGSTRAVPTPILHTLATAFAGIRETSRRDGVHTVGERRYPAGGYVLEHCPGGISIGLGTGVPLNGGIIAPRTADASNLFEQISGLPLSGSVLPSRSRRAVAPEISGDSPDVTVLGADPPVGIPLAARPLGCALFGMPGSGKTVAMSTMALADLHAGRGFVFVDVHGQAARHLVASATALGRPIVHLSHSTPGDRFAPISALNGEEDRRRVDADVTHFCDALAASLPDPAWTGPRFRSLLRAAGELAAAQAADMAQLAEWMYTPDALRARVMHPMVSSLACSVLTNAADSQDAASLLGWCASKLSDLSSAGTVLASPGHGISIPEALQAGTPIICDLAGMAASEALTIGTLLVSSVLEAGIDRGPGGPAYTVFLDEALRFLGAERALTRVLLEGRKFGISAVVAAQSLAALPPRFADLLAAVDNHVVFRSSPDTAQTMAEVLGVPAEDLRRLPPLHGYLKVGSHEAVPIVVPIPATPQPRPRRPRKRPASTPTAAPSSARTPADRSGVPASQT